MKSSLPKTLALMAGQVALIGCGFDTFTGGQGVENSAAAPGAAADLVVMREPLAEKTKFVTVEATQDGCAFRHGCVSGSGQRNLMKFETATLNQGTADLWVGSPDEMPDRFTWDECHEHYHFDDFAAYQLLNPDGSVAAVGHKQSFALQDIRKVDSSAGPRQFPRFEGNEPVQGISKGWADVYDNETECQYIDVTGVAPGDYVLEVTVNPAKLLAESDYDNNTTRVPVTIPAEFQDASRDVPEGWTCNPEFYGAGDGCDCGCGARDLDCRNPDAAVCDYCNSAGSCAAAGGDNACDLIASGYNAVCRDEAGAGAGQGTSDGTGDGAPTCPEGYIPCQDGGGQCIHPTQCGNGDCDCGTSCWDETAGAQCG
jgi:hypothetical protein